MTVNEPIRTLFSRHTHYSAEVFQPLHPHTHTLSLAPLDITFIAILFHSVVSVWRTKDLEARLKSIFFPRQADYIVLTWGFFVLLFQWLPAPWYTKGKPSRGQKFPSRLVTIWKRVYGVSFGFCFLGTLHSWTLSLLCQYLEERAGWLDI